jgi:hypothetical protein
MNGADTNLRSTTLHVTKQYLTQQDETPLDMTTQRVTTLYKADFYFDLSLTKKKGMPPGNDCQSSRAN